MPIDLSQPSYTVKKLKNVHIPMENGIYLSADLFLPEAPGQFPVILQYFPYRKDDASAYAAGAFYYFAERGFAGALVDIRGTGGSQGIILDEYTLQEQLDGCQVIDWLSRQSWCNGNVGMWGASYSGFNTIQVATHNPPALKAIIPMFATDDRYNDDVHFYGGCLIGIEQVLYPAGMVTMNAVQPLAEINGEDWISNWMQRLDGNEPWILNWFRHQTEDDYWKPGSLKTDYSAIHCPVMLIGGWADGYTNPVFRMLTHLKVPNKALVGPWLHASPDNGVPGPNLNFLHEMCRWWAQWLGDEETGIMDEPRIALYSQDGAQPTSFEKYMPGKWQYVDRWPPEEVKEHPFYLAEDGRLRQRTSKKSGRNTYRYLATVGSAAGVWCAVLGHDSLTRDQSCDESRSLTYTSEILTEPLVILGAPKAILHVSSSAEVSFFCVKIDDIFPDGSSRLVCRGILNATHRTSHRNPLALTPGEMVELEIPLKNTSWTFQAGHHIRVAISSSDWPWVWPSPYPATNAVYWGGSQPSRIILPVVEKALTSARPEPKFLEALNSSTIHYDFGGGSTWQFIQDILKGYSIMKVGSRSQGKLPGAAFSMEHEAQAEFGSSDEHPEATYAKALVKTSIIQIDGRTDITGRTAIRSTASHFYIDVELNVEKDGELFFTRKWMEAFPRRLL